MLFSWRGVEKGQTAEQALRDELRQETGLQIVGNPIIHGLFYNNNVSKRDHVLAYYCDVQGGLEAKPTSIEISEIGYFSSEDLPPDTDPGTVRRIREMVFGDERTEVW